MEYLIHVSAFGATAGTVMDTKPYIKLRSSRSVHWDQQVARTTSTTLTARLPILNPGEYDLWLMMIEQYFLMTDYSLWEVIMNGNKVLKRTVGETEQEYEPTRLLLEIQGEVITQEDMNLKLLRSLPSEWKTHALIWRNKEEIETISLDDFTNSNSSTNEADNTAYGVSATHTQSNHTSRDNLSDAVICAFLARDSSTGQEVLPVQILRSQFNLLSYKASLESVEARLAHYKKNKAVFEESINVLNLEVKLRDNALVENKKKLEKAKKERVELKLTLEKFQNSSKSLNNLLESQVIDKFKTGLGYNAASSTAASPTVENFVNSSELLENQENNKSKSDKGYHAVPLPFTGNFIPFKPDLTFMDEIVESENMDVITIVTPSNGKKVESNHESVNVKSNGDAVEPKIVRKNSFRPPVIEDWNSDDESEVEIIPKDKTVSSSTKKIKFVKSARETVEKVIRPVWNNSSRVNHKNFANKMTHPHPNRRFVPQIVLTKFGKINITGASVNTAVKLVNTAGSKPIVNHPRPISNAYKKGYSQVTRPFNKYSANKNSIFNKKVNTIRVKDTTARDRAVVSENKGKGVNAVKASGNPQQKEYKEKGVIDSGCSRHITGNKCYLIEYEVYNGGFVSFRYGKGRISGKGKIKTGTLDFDDVYFCKELKYNLFSVSQICDKKNNVLFIDTECLVLSSDFKLLDESQVLLRVPRKDNIYSVDLKSVVPTGGLTCLFAKNGVAERKNRTLIEAARTMLVDSKLPTTFWAEAVNTACYVLKWCC
ncbi:ribonuclease H-like domain-containing protein [Tanacetum coccineum]